MSYFSGNYWVSKAIGCFEEKTHGKQFEYRNIKHCEFDNSWGISHGAIHEISVGIETRLGIVKKTVCDVIIDEDDSGNPVWEKWYIKSNWVNLENDK